MMPPTTDRDLGALAAALGGAGPVLAATERTSIARGQVPSPDQVARVRDLVLQGEDPLGNAYCQLREPAVRRKSGAV